MSGQGNHRGAWINFAGLILAALIGGIFSLLATSKGGAEPTPPPPTHVAVYLTGK